MVSIFPIKPESFLMGAVVGVAGMFALSFVLDVPTPLNKNWDASQVEGQLASLKSEIQLEQLKSERDRIKAQSALEAQRVTAEAEAQRSKVIAMAEAEAIRLRGQAEADSLRVRGESIAPNPLVLNLERIHKWNGDGGFGK